MKGAFLLLLSLLVFAAGYFIYSRFIGHVIGIEPSRKTPAEAQRDDVDYMPAHPLVLFGHHFAAIAGAGPIVGPIFAAEFGWGAVALWVVLGSVFIGAMHDMLALFLSVRHEGKSIGVVIGDLIGAPARILFLMFSWSVLVLVIAEFTRQIAITFVADPAIATSSMLFIVEAVVFGLCVYRFGMSLAVSSCIFVPMMFVSVWIGELCPLDIVALGLSADAARTTWILILLGYCFLASVCPIWVLLQPRGYLSSYVPLSHLACAQFTDGIPVGDARGECARLSFDWNPFRMAGACDWQRRGNTCVRRRRFLRRVHHVLDLLQRIEKWPVGAVGCLWGRFPVRGPCRGCVRLPDLEVNGGSSGMFGI